MDKPEQDGWDLSPAYDYHDDRAFTFNGVLMVPLTPEAEPPKRTPVSVKMNFKDFVKLRRLDDYDNEIS